VGEGVATLEEGVASPVGDAGPVAARVGDDVDDDGIGCCVEGAESMIPPCISLLLPGPGSLKCARLSLVCECAQRR
jgi:hypothetical protein